MRPTRPSGHHTSLPRPRPRGHRAVLVALVTALVLTGCGRGGGGGDDIAEPDLEPGQPDRGDRARGPRLPRPVDVRDARVPGGSDGDLPIEADEAAIQAAASAIRAWLDQVLSERNRGLTTTVGASEVDAAAFAAPSGSTVRRPTACSTRRSRTPPT
jgi:hypothetical protein